MSNIVLKDDKVIAEVIGGTLVCENNPINWLTIADWCEAHETLLLVIEIKANDITVYVDNGNVNSTLSLLEHFHHQDTLSIFNPNHRN